MSKLVKQWHKCHPMSEFVCDFPNPWAVYVVKNSHTEGGIQHVSVCVINDIIVDLTFNTIFFGKLMRWFLQALMILNSDEGDL